MRQKNLFSLFQKTKPHHQLRSYGHFEGQHSALLKLNQACKLEMDEVLSKLPKADASNLLDSIYERLNVINTHHSLKLGGKYSLSLEETEQLLIHGKTSNGGDFIEQLRARNHFDILKYCRWYQQEFTSGDGEDTHVESNEYFLLGLYNITSTFILMFGEGIGYKCNTKDGTFDSPANYYFFEHPENLVQVNKCRELLVETFRNGTDDPFLNAAKIHNEFVKGYQFVGTFGLMFCRLYMNFALMLSGYLPTIIDESYYVDYLQFSQAESLADPKLMALLLMESFNKSYQNYVFPLLKAELIKQGIEFPLLGESLQSQLFDRKV